MKKLFKFTCTSCNSFTQRFLSHCKTALSVFKFEHEGDAGLAGTEKYNIVSIHVYTGNVWTSYLQKSYFKHHVLVICQRNAVILLFVFLPTIRN